MTESLRVFSVFCEVKVHAASLETDLRWQPHAVDYWTRLMNGAPDPLLRRGYADRVTRDTERLMALRRLQVLNELETNE